MPLFALLGAGKPYRTLADLQDWLKYARSQPAEVTRLRRSAQLLIMSLCVMISGLGMLILLPVVMGMILTMILTLNNVQLERVLQDYERVQAAELVLAGASASDPFTVFVQSVGLPHDDYLIAEMREWRPTGSKGAHDDGLDAVAGAILNERVRIGRIAPAARREDWRHPAGGFTARQDFKP